MSESLIDWNAYLQVASQSDIGMRRQTNQDNMSISLASNMDHWQSKGHLFIVADGMGAHAAGELASKLAVDHINHLYARFNEASVGEALQKSMTGANAEINRRGQANEEFHNMGTTCSSLVLVPEGAVIGHIGDSRVYRLSNNRCEQLTFDHSLVWEMRAAGQLTKEAEASGRIPKNVITRSLGPYPECKIDLEGPFPISPGDTFLLCSDGLTGVIEDAELGSIMANMSPDEATRVLVDLANLRGGPDNITVVIVKVIQPQMQGFDGRRTSRKKNGGAVATVTPWGVLAISLLLIAFFCITQKYLAAILPAVAAIGSLVFIIYQQVLAGVAKKSGSPDGRAYGRAPYVRVNCANEEKFAAQMAKILLDLQSAASKQQWKIDWPELKTKISHAEQAVSEKKYSHAVGEYGRAISYMMDQLRNQGGEDSTIF